MKDITSKRVLSHFENSKTYKAKTGVVHEEDPSINDFVQKKSVANNKILEIGGSGALLDLILQNNPQVEEYNVEIAYNTYKNQVNPKINLVEGNALSLPFEENSFDLVIDKNLLHHIVGNTSRKSKSYAKKAIKEMNRV